MIEGGFITDNVLGKQLDGYKRSVKEDESNL